MLMLHFEYLVSVDVNDNRLQGWATSNSKNLYNELLDSV